MNFFSGLLPVATEMAAIWKSGNIPVVAEGATGETALLDWSDPNGICGAINDDFVGSILGISHEAVIVTSNSGTNEGTAGIVSYNVYCTYEVPNSNGTDPLFPHRLEVTLFRYAIVADAAALYAAFKGYGADCVVNETAIMWECDGGNSSTATRGLRSNGTKWVSISLP